MHVSLDRVIKFTVFHQKGGFVKLYHLLTFHKVQYSFLETYDKRLDFTKLGRGVYSTVNVSFRWKPYSRMAFDNDVPEKCITIPKLTVIFSRYYFINLCIHVRAFALCYGQSLEYERRQRENNSKASHGHIF